MVRVAMTMDGATPIGDFHEVADRTAAFDWILAEAERRNRRISGYTRGILKPDSEVIDFGDYSMFGLICPGEEETAATIGQGASSPEIVDELTTPGCPQCAVKHLSAALSYVADMDPATRGNLESHDMYTSLVEQILRARALINYAEACAGYASHLPFAIGLLERAERAQIMVEGTRTFRSDATRKLRLVLQSGRTPCREDLADASSLAPLAYAWAHIIEAQRELPCFRTLRLDAEDLQKAIAEIRAEYFPAPVSGAGLSETTQTGEPEMATAKKKTVAAPVKGKGAGKGGKCCDKGGKSKK